MSHRAPTQLLVVATLLTVLAACSPSPAPEQATSGDQPANERFDALGHYRAPHVEAHPAVGGGRLELPQGRPADPRTAQPAPLTPRKAHGLRPLALGDVSVPPGSHTVVGLKLLVVTPTSDDYDYEATATLLRQVGLPFDTLVASESTLTAGLLQASPGRGNYNGIVLVTDSLAYDDGTGNWVSAFAPDEWALLHDYEAAYGVREATMFARPDGAGTGLDYLGGEDTRGNPVAVRLTPAGSALFDYLKPDAPLVVRNAWLYYGRPVDASTVPLLTTADGRVVAAERTAPDGRESLALTFSESEYHEHSQTLAYGVFRWVSRGVFLGEQKHYLSVQVDDYFLDSPLWDPALLDHGDASYRIPPKDLQAFIAWQNRFSSARGLFANYTTDIAFNGVGFQMGAPAVCGLNFPRGVDPTSAFTRCHLNDFRWISHTYSHLYFDGSTSPKEAQSELQKNRTVATGRGGLGLSAANYDPNVLVTGNYSGLGYLDHQTPPVNTGKSGASVNLVRAAAQLGYRTLAGNSGAPVNTTPQYPNGPYCSSTPEDCSQNNPSPNTGQMLPPNLPQNDILLVPRNGTNVLYDVSTPAELTSEYNAYNRWYWGRDLSYDEIVDKESDVLAGDLRGGSMDPEMYHQANLRDYGGGRSLLGDVLDAAAAKYSRVFNVPALSLPMGTIGDEMRARAAVDAGGAGATWDKTTGTVTVTAPTRGLKVRLTNPVSGERYGSDRVLEVTAGRAVLAGTGR